MNPRLTMLLALPVLWAGGAHAEPSGDTATASDTCVPAAVLSGEQELVMELGRELNLLGVTNRVTANCPSVTATVEKSSTGVMVSLRQPDGRRATRSLSDARIAATWIDSWLHEDLGAPLLAARLLPQPPTQTLSSPPPSAAPLTVMATAKPRRYLASVGYETIDRGQDASWHGLRAKACAHLGPACVGLGVALSQSNNETFSPDDLFEFTQQSVDLLAQVQVPLSVGQATISPSLALGASWFQAKRIEDTPCFDEDGDGLVFCPEDTFGEQPSSRSSWSPAAEAGLGLSLPLAKTIRLELGGALGIRPFAASQALVTDEIDPPPLPAPCEEPNGPGCEEEPQQPTFLAMPGEPSQSWRLFIGLQVEL